MTILSSGPHGAHLFESKKITDVSPPVEKNGIFGKDGFTFGDILDIVNPLQHIPIVGSIYRNITGDTIAPAMQIAGGALFGGPIGAVVSLVTTSFQSYLKSDSVDPNSPYQGPENDAIPSEAIVDNQPAARTINMNDYTLEHQAIHNPNPQPVKALEQLGIRATPVKEPIPAQVLTPAVSAIQRRPVYQSADGIINLAHVGTENYARAVSATNKPGNQIDILVGARTGSG